MKFDINEIPFKFVFAIATYKRESDLRRLISSIDASIRICNKNIKVSILIRDNDNKSKNNARDLQNFSPLSSIYYIRNIFNEGGKNNVWQVLKEATKYGEYVVVVSDDDYILPDFFNILCRYLEQTNYDYIVTNFFSQNFDFKAKKNQLGLEKPFLKNIVSYKSDVIISNRIITGTCFTSELINRVTSLIDEKVYLEQFYPCQFIGCFSKNCLRVNERMSIHQVGNKIFWEDYEVYNDMVLSRIEGYIKAFQFEDDKSEMKLLLLKTILNYPIWFAFRLILTKNNIPIDVRFKFLIYKAFHLKIIRDLMRLTYFFITKIKS
tara:strand:- start:405 stop:1367 length:963 start_codon:yes stop_codon:yes gene_type:complete